MRPLLALYSFAILHLLGYLISISGATAELAAPQPKSTTDVGVADDRSANRVRARDSEATGTIANFSGIEILGISCYEDLLAVALTKSIVLINITEANAGHVTKRTSVELPEAISGGVVEFKLFDYSSLFICDNERCRLCTLSPEQKCYKYDLDDEFEKRQSHLKRLSAANAVVDSNRHIALRYAVANDTNPGIGAAISKYDPKDNNESSTPPVQSALDVSWIADWKNNHHLAIGFNRDGYTYFVGSTRRYLEPVYEGQIVESIEKAPIRNAVRITRICDREKKETIDSRIDLALLCGNFGWDDEFTCDAAVYNKENDSLTLVMQPLKKSQGAVLCSFSVKELAAEFDRVWDDCQKNVFLFRITDKKFQHCYHSSSIEEMPKECLTYTHAANSVRPCSRYGALLPASTVYSNCDLHKKSTGLNNYGWLEQFYPFNGTVYATVPHGSPKILRMQQLSGDTAFIVLTEGGSIARIVPGAKDFVWSQKFSPNSGVSISVDPKSNRIFYATGDKVNYVTISCNTLYDSCESLEQTGWSDPLNCMWCERAKENGSAISEKEDCSGKPVREGYCPPFLHSVKPDGESDRGYSLFIFSGDRLDRYSNKVSGKLCDQECTPWIPFTANKIACRFSPLISVSEKSCTASLEGELKTGGNYTAESTVNMEAAANVATPPTKASSKSKSKKVAAAVSCVVIFVALICLIVWIFCRYNRKRKRRLWQSGTESGSQLPFGSINGTAFPHASVESNPYMGHKANGYPLKKFNPYERLYLEIDPKLKINLEDIDIGEEIGKGNFGVVYKGIYHDSSGATREVACKTIDSHNDGVVCGVSEFLREGLTMANFHHPHVTQLIGISLSMTGCPMIVTDYLANGDLRHYIVNPNNRLTFGNLLDFGIQIADGMAYLHEKKFIHRDLAARNCMLDAKLTVKIADFGLSRDVSRCGMYEAMNKNRGIPIRWMPIESLEEQQYTFKGDVWAYGVVLWELATRGLIPYGDLDMGEILRLLKLGHRLNRPKGCPDILYNQVMLVCWMEAPDRRPTFYELKDMVKDVVEQLKNGIPGTSLLNNHYERVSNRSAATTPVSYPKPFPAGPVVTDL